MGILSLSGDSLKYDRLKEDPLKNEYDPVGKAEGKRVKTYDPELGWAMHPEEKAGVLDYRNRVNDAVGKQQSAIGNYQSTFNSAMSDAEKQAQGILSEAQGQVAGIKRYTTPTIAVNVVDASGDKIEGTYHMPKEVAEQLAQEKGVSTRWNEDGSFNVSVRTNEEAGGRTIGEELHTAFRDAEAQLAEYQKIYDSQYDTAKEAGAIQIGSLQSEIDTQRNIANNAYNSNIGMASQQLEALKGKWTGFVAEQRAAFQQGIQTNNGGIADLVNSGALTLKGKVA